ncbi:ATP-dependent DNA helicase PIF1, partial [Trifolium pratense]
MGEEMNLNEKSCVSLSPNSVLPSHKYCLNVKKEKAYRNEKFKEYFSEINSSCKSLPCRSHKLEANTENRRGSMYQSSNQNMVNDFQSTFASEGIDHEFAAFLMRIGDEVEPTIPDDMVKIPPQIAIPWEGE